MGEGMQPGAVVDMLYIAGLAETGAFWCPLSHTLRHQVLGHILQKPHVSHCHIFVHRWCVSRADCMGRCCHRLRFQMYDFRGPSLLCVIRVKCEGSTNVSDDVTMRCCRVNLHA